MKALMPVLIGLFCLSLPLIGADKKPLTKAAIRKAAKKPTGELTTTDSEKVTILIIRSNQLTALKGLEKLTKLAKLDLGLNPALTKAQIAELQKALPKCEIKHDAK